MGLTKVDYIYKTTVIPSQNLNDIQDAIIANEEDIADLQTQIDGKQAKITYGTVSDSADTYEKTVNISAAQPSFPFANDGAMIAVKFINGNSLDRFRLGIGSAGFTITCGEIAEGDVVLFRQTVIEAGGALAFELTPLGITPTALTEAEIRGIWRE